VHVPHETVVVPGQPFDVHLKISRAAKLAEPARIELRIPEELAGLVSAEPLIVPVDQQEAELRIATVADPRLVGVKELTIRATAFQDGKWPAVSEAKVEIDFGAGPSR
jgi:hypothetical protein